MGLIRLGQLKKHSKKLSVSRFVILLLSVFFLVACEKVTQKSAVSINSSAYYTAFQDSVSTDWQTRLNGQVNTGYRPISISFTVENKDAPFSVGFACPSAKGTKPHEVFIFYATPAEMDTVNFNCKRAIDDIALRPLYGKISGVSLPTLVSPQGEKAVLSFSREKTIEGWEAYASMERTGVRDLVAYKRDQFEPEPWKHKTFYLKRKAALEIDEKPEYILADFDGSEIAAYIKDFDLNAISTVNLGGVGAGDVIESRVGFLSDNNSYLPLITSNATSFNFLPAPLKLYTGSLPGFTNQDEFNPGEGHEMQISVLGPTDQQPIRTAYKFFSESNNVTHDLVIPKAVDVQPVVGSANVKEFQQLILNWGAYNDVNAEKTQLYRWHFKGSAAAPHKDYPTSVNTGEVEWIVHVTPGWIKSVSGSNSNYSLILPTDLDVNVKNTKGEAVYTWRQEWSFEPSSSLDWEFAAIVVNDKFSAEDVVEYYLNKNFDILDKAANGTYSASDFVFGESFVRGSVTP